MSKMIAEWPFQTPLSGWHKTFQHNLCVGGHHHVYALRVNHRNPSAAQESGESNFIDTLWKRKNGCHHENRIGADDHGYFETFSLLFGIEIMDAPAFHALPMHAGRIVAENLKSIEAAVSHLRNRIVADDHPVGDETSGVSRPTFENGQT